MPIVNKHHKIPKSRGWSADKCNIKRREIVKHMKRHSVFSNKTPVEQIIEVLKTNEGVWNKKFIDEIKETLLENEGEYYIERAYKELIEDLSYIKEKWIEE